MDNIFGYTWEQIQAAQQGKQFRQTVDTSKPIDHSATAQDIELLEKHGMDGLKEMGFFGVIDRLSRR